LYLKIAQKTKKKLYCSKNINNIKSKNILKFKKNKKKIEYTKKIFETLFNTIIDFLLFSFLFSNTLSTFISNFVVNKIVAIY